MTFGLSAALAVLLVLAVGMLLKLASDSRNMSAEVGVVGGRLSQCPRTPNCVSSDAPPTDSHYIDSISDPTGSKWGRLEETVRSMPGANLVRSEDDYLYFTFTTNVMRFVDDVEFHHRASTGEIALRSASRVGRGDMNANRNRLESIRAAL